MEIEVLDDIELWTIKTLIVQKKYLLSGREKQALALKPDRHIALLRTKCEALDKSMRMHMRFLLDTQKCKLKELVEKLQAVDPKKVLKRGYAILFSENSDSVIVSVQALTPKKKVRVLLSDGTKGLTVDDD